MKGTFTNIRPVPSRSVVQFVIEVPHEQSNAALSELGGIPSPGESIWVEVHPISNKTSEPSLRGLTASNQIAICCKSYAFRLWYGCETPDETEAKILEDISPDDMKMTRKRDVDRSLWAQNRWAEIYGQYQAQKQGVSHEREERTELEDFPSVSGT